MFEKLNLIAPFVLDILQRYCKLAILGPLGMHGYGYKKTLVLACKKL